MSESSFDIAELTQSRTLFLVYSVYRLGISLILLALFLVTGLGDNNVELFLPTTALYLGCNIALLLLFSKHWQPSENALILILASDIILLQLAASASGIVQSGLGVLLVASVAAGSIFLKRGQVLLVPAFATITLLVNVTIALMQHRVGQSDIVASGWLGITFFVTSITVRYLTERLQASELLAQRESALAKKLEQLNSLIIERMQTGIAVINQNSEIVLCNDSGRKLLGASANPANKKLQLVNTNIAQAFEQWQNAADRFSNESPPLESFAGGPAVRLIFIELDESHQDCLMFIDDISKIQQHAQQLKLASLGQLTASIAHEVRNPLGAVSHAAQLLEESTASDEDRKLTRIIRQQAKRCSRIIDSIMAVSRGNASNITRVDIVTWLPGLIETYQIDKDCVIELDTPAELLISFDLNQLTQILTNLFDNGLRYSLSAMGENRILLRADSDSDGLPLLDIIDYGPGVAEENIEHLFEPFFTTETTGSGLGLYICRELCQANQARLSYISHCNRSAKHGSDRHCFRINFAHPDRKSFVMHSQDNSLEKIGIDQQGANNAKPSATATDTAGNTLTTTANI